MRNTWPPARSGFWVAHPSTRSVTVHRADGATITYAADVITDEELLPGFSLPLSEIFD